MTTEQRLSNLENLVNALSKKIDNNKFYQQADIDGTRQNISEITPYTETKTAYIGDTEIVFSDVPSGNLNVFFRNYSGEYKYTKYEYMKIADRLIIYFEPLEEVTEITISIS